MLMDYLVEHDAPIAKSGKTHLKDIMKLKLGCEVPACYDRAMSSSPNPPRDGYQHFDGPPKYFDPSRTAEKIDKKFSSDDAKCGGAIEENLEHFIQEHQITCDKYCISREYHVKFMGALLKGVAKTFFLN